MPNLLDDLIAWVSPKAALERERARLTLERVRGYDGAKGGRRTAGWTTQGSSANTEIARDSPKLRERSRDLSQNNGWALRARDVIVSNVVGAGIVGQPKHSSKRRDLAAKKLWEAWAGSTLCDADGRHDFHGLQALAMKTIVESGEVLIRKLPRQAKDGLPVPLQLQLLEPEHLDVTRDADLGGNRKIVQGIELDASGQRVAYWLYPTHPGEATAGSSTLKSSRVPAADIAHVYRLDRPGQRRGVPWVSPVMIDVKDLNDYEKAQLLKQKIAACFAAFVVETEAPELAPDDDEIIDTLEPGAVEILPPGRDIRFANPPSNDGYEPYVRQLLHKIAAGYGITYESLTNDYSQVNFSSGRMGHIEFARNIDTWRWQMLIPQMCSPVWTWFVEAAGLTGALLDGTTITWTPPRREMIDPTKETEAVKAAVRAGLKSWSEAVREQGEDPDAVAAELAEDLKRFDELGLVLDSDPRQDPRRQEAIAVTESQPQ
ncbi:phage portal protein [Synechococcus elongatus]|uniref:Phage portal protein, lambda n=2 Tax=Synechococcus elongatus TaxID=32046 RepID=Q31QA4_SYNE7|nr:phage portal protein [Synechococcus elongatus]ABB56765.1 Phage portal protein, lambda [Synechococcus elongatus PCC 7942 = FACHB-805]AJD58695.1 phage portal protein [Synechococcus elongatus UTEX 2973]MBD2588627.1 phage portal protein [Synechococcus elongatus FACHB-242]MBD2689784.1 phage portal protein [Synechococcus elongatus FACHB-1061]MBD2708391.1 phage portal protein [Synechococcus elongatus PCC 7942 = FACHB-805]